MAVLLLAGCDLRDHTASGNRLYRRGEYAGAAAEYAAALEGGSRSPRVSYGLGTALLRLERYPEARGHLEGAAAAGDSATRQRAHYNAGNTDLEPVFRGRTPEPERRAALERAVGRYRRALLLDPADADAKWNLELAQRLLASEEETAGGGGGGGGGEESPNPEPDPRGEASSSGGLTRAQAEEILAGAEQAERELQKEKLRRERGPRRAGRDW